MIKLTYSRLVGGIGNMVKNYTIKDHLVSEADFRELSGKASLNENDGIPEFTDGKDIINEFAFDLNRFAKSEDIPCTMVYDKDNFE